MKSFLIFVVFLREKNIDLSQWDHEYIFARRYVRVQVAIVLSVTIELRRERMFFQ